MPGYRNKDGRGCKPATNSVTYVSCNIGKRWLRFSFSEDMVARLGYYGEARLNTQTYLHLRLRIVRYPWLAPHAAVFQLTTFAGPDTYKLSKSKKSPRYISEILARHFEVKPGVPGHKFEDIHWDYRGMMVQFPVSSMTDEAQERWERIARWRKLKEAAAT